MWFLVFVLVASAAGTAIVLIRNRRPTSMEASISEFERSLQALAPDDNPGVRQERIRRRASGPEPE